MNSQNKFIAKGIALVFFWLIVIATLATLFSCEKQDICIGYEYKGLNGLKYQEVSVPCEWYNEPIRDMGKDGNLILFFLENNTVWSVEEYEWWDNTLTTFDNLSINTYETIKPYRRW